MKAERRHHLKENELAEIIGDLPELWRKYGSAVVTWVLIAVLVIGGAWWGYNYFVGKKLQAQGRLQQLTATVQLRQAMAAQQTQAMMMAEGERPEIPPFDVTGEISQLGEIAESSASTGTKMQAQFQKAEALRSQLLFGPRALDESEREAICQQAEAAYQTLVDGYGAEPLALGAGKIGLALVAEDRAQWDAARKLYEDVVAAEDGLLAGTSYPQLAAGRLELLERISDPVYFVKSAPVEEAFPGLVPEAEALPIAPMAPVVEETAPAAAD